MIKTKKNKLTSNFSLFNDSRLSCLVMSVHVRVLFQKPKVHVKSRFLKPPSGETKIGGAREVRDEIAVRVSNGFFGIEGLDPGF